MAEGIKRSDVAADDLVSLPKELTDEFKKLAAQLDIIITKLKGVGTAVSQSATIPKVTKETEDLTSAQKELEKITKQVETANAKLSDEYIAQKKALADANQQLKEKILLGDRDAKTVTAQNSSQAVLGAALAKNQRTYAQLKTEQDRNSKSGKELKDIIDKQYKSFDELSKGVHEHTHTIGAYAEELSFLAPELGEVAEKTAGWGEKLAELATSPVGVFLIGLAAVFTLVKESISTYFETTAAGEETLDRFKGKVEGVTGALKKSLAEFGEGIVGDNISLGGLALTVANLVPGLSQLLVVLEKYGAFDKLKEAAKEGLEVANEQLELDDKLIANTIAKSEAENKANRDIFESRDKIKNTDVERLALAKEAFKIREDQLEREKELATEQLKIEVDRIHLSSNDPTPEQKQKIADLSAHILDLDTQFLQLSRRNHAEIVSMTLDIEKTERESILRRKNAQIDLRKSELDLVVKTNDDIIANENSTLQQRQSALTQATSAEFEIIEKDTQQQLLLAENAAKERAITRNNGLAEDKKGLEQALENDKSYQQELLKIQNEHDTKSEAEATKYTATLKDILIKGFNDVTLAAKRAGDDQVDKLNTAFNAGSISANKFEVERARTIKQNNIDLIRQQIDFQKTVLNVKTAFGQETLQDERKLHDLEVSEAQAVADRKLAIEKEYHARVIELQNVAFDSAEKIGANIFDADINRLQARENALKMHYDEDIALAGNNQNLKDKLQADFDKKQQQLEKQRIEQERRKAIYEKELAAAKILINTAEAESKLLDGIPETLPFIAFVAAEGAAELAVVLSTPLPQYEDGTDFAVGGKSIVGEIGTEMFVTPSGQLGFTPSKPTVMDIERGTKVFTHEETMAAMALAVINGGSQQQDNDEVVSKLDEVKRAITGSRQPSINHVKNGLELLDVVEERENFTRIRRNKTMGKWVK